MSALGSSAAGYGAAHRALASPRSIEYQLFSRVTASLARASAPGGTFPAVTAALHENTRLWATLVEDLRSGRNALPPDLRDRLLALAAFVLRHSAKVLAGEADAAPIIDVNRAIMRGLRGERTFEEGAPCPG